MFRGENDLQEIASEQRHGYLFFANSIRGLASTDRETSIVACTHKSW